MRCRLVMLSLLTVLVISASAVYLLNDNQTEADTGDSIRVWIQDKYGEYQLTTVSASSVKGAIEEASHNLGIHIEYDDLGKIKSVDGVKAEPGMYWNIHQWMPYGYYDWTSVGFDDRSNSWLVSGTSYCLHMSGMEIVEGTTVYDKPQDLKPESDGYMFIRFTKEYDSDSEYIRDVFTPEMRMEGFWIKGHGSNWGEVIKNAMESNKFQCEFMSGFDDNGNDLQYWFSSFFGLKDQNLGDSTSWAYWSQWFFMNGEWSYNNFTMGYYDPAVYKYAACIYIQSYGGSKDIGGDMPDPEAEFPHIVSIKQSVKFVADGETVGETIVHYGKSLTVDQIPDYTPKDGYAFLGWGDTTIPIVEETVFTAQLEKLTNSVTFVSEGKTVSVVEVKPGGKIVSSPTPVKSESYTHRYEFKGWSVSPESSDIVDLQSYAVNSPLKFYAVFDEIALETKEVTFIIGEKSTKINATVGKPIPSNMIPAAPEGYIIAGWDKDIAGVVSEDTTFTADLKTIVFSLTYMDSNGNVWGKEEVEYGRSATESSHPEKEKTEDYTYGFLYWTVGNTSKKADLSCIKSDLTLYPFYESKLIEKCTVKFVLNGDVIAEVKVVKGEKLVKSQIPSVTVTEKQIFSGWQGTDETIMQNTEFKATLVDKVYNSVRFISDGMTIHSEDVEDGKFSTYASTPSKSDSEYASYEFMGWTKDPSVDSPTIADPLKTEITEDTTFYAVFKENKFPTSKVTFVSNGITVSEIEVVTGRVLNQSQIPEATREGYLFKGWNPGTDRIISEDTTFTAIFEILVLNVTYTDWNGNTLYIESVNYGESATYSSKPARQDSEYASYTFKWWVVNVGDSSAVNLSVIKSDIVVIAVYNEHLFPTSKVTFVLNGDVISTVDVVTGRTLKQSQIPDPTKEGMTFSGWGEGVYSVIDSDRTFSATQEIIKLKVKFYSEDGVLMHTESVNYGSPSVSNMTASKDRTQKNTFVFKGWSKDPGADVAVIEDLSSIKTNLVLKPVFEAILNKYTVTFCDYDRSVISTVSVEYGMPVTQFPDIPFREQSVDKVFSFKGWSISPVGWNNSPLNCITESKTTYAFYDYTVRQYALEIYDGDELIGSMNVDYGSFLRESVYMDTSEGYLLKLFRDRDCTVPVNTSYSFSGYTKLYAVKMPGCYEYATDGSFIDKSTVAVSFDIGAASKLKSDGKVTVVSDISQFSDGKKICIGMDSVSNLRDVLGHDATIRFVMYRGYYEFGIGNLYDVMSDRGCSELTISMDKGPTSLVKVNAALKKINHDSLMSLGIGMDGMSVDSDLLKVTAYVPYSPDPNELNSPRVWAVDAGTGVLTQINCSYGNGYLKFVLCDMTLYATGTAFQRSDVVDTSDPRPYGDVETESFQGESNAVVIAKMTFEGCGYTLFVPSYYEGSEVAGIGQLAFSGVINVGTIVIPATVKKFDWSSLTSGDIRSVYFMGNAPEFSGDLPATVTIYRLQDSDGWEDYDTEILLMGSYRFENGSMLRYCLINNEIVVCGYSGESELKIPSYISMNGTEYPVAVIGPDSFMESEINSVKIPETVREIQSRAFQSSKITTVSWSNNSSLSYICDGAFRDCTLLRNFTAPDGTRYIGNDAFMNCRMIAGMDIPDSVKIIGSRTFYNCVKLSGISLGSGITEIKDYTFAYCVMLDNVYLPSQITVIGTEAFANCRMMSYIDTNKVQTIGDGAFMSCDKLKSMVLNDGLESLGKDVFAGTPMNSIVAYCPQPSGFEDAFPESVLNELNLTVNYDVSNSWSVNHTVLEKEDDMMESFEGRTMPYVIGGMIVLFIILGVYCFRHRMI